METKVELHFEQTSNYRHWGEWYWECGDDWSARYYKNKGSAAFAHTRIHAGKECTKKEKK
jgi:hypothetical protein